MDFLQIIDHKRFKKEPKRIVLRCFLYCGLGDNVLVPINSMLQFNKTYFALTVLLFNTEILIALYVNDEFIRPYFGDVLVVILIYCFIKTFLKIKVITAAIFTLLFSFGVELLQYCNIVEKLNLGGSRIARTVIGSSFEWKDILCYIAGILMVLLVEKAISKNNNLSH